MKKLYALSLIIFTAATASATDTPAQGEVCVMCGGAKAMPAPAGAAAIKDLGTQLGCGSAEGNKKGVDKLEERIKKDGAKPELVIKEFSERTSGSVTYKISPEKILKPGETIYIAVPEDIADRALNFAILGHRQDPTTQVGTTPGEKWDKVPGQTSMQFYSEEDKEWKHWGGPASGPLGAKFAEVRGAAEMENLYEWSKLGHVGLNSKKRSTAPLKSKVVRLVSVGQDPVNVAEISLKVEPPKASTYVEGIFSKGTAFADHDKGTSPTYGGGQNSGGKFPDALELRRGVKSDATLPSGWKVEGSDLIIPVPPGKTITGIEVAGGDTHPDGVTNSDGGTGTQGWARISMGISSGKNTEWMVQDENVPPEGIIMGSPKTCGYVTKSGDTIRIRGSRDHLYIMGVRIGLKDAQ